jgi:hypothetical protein
VDGPLLVSTKRSRSPVRGIFLIQKLHDLVGMKSAMRMRLEAVRLSGEQPEFGAINADTTEQGIV